MTDFAKMTAADVMQRDVVTIGPDESLQEAMALMTENHVSGLPVLNSKDRCVGVISASDILSFQQEQAEGSADAEENMASYFDPDTERWESIRVFGGLDELPEVPVGEIMSGELVSVTPNTPLREVAQKMHENEIHRILVVDEKQFLHGIISSSDFVRLFAEAG